MIDGPDLLWENHYTCPRCGHDWYDEWECQVNDECPECGLSDIQPDESREINRHLHEPVEPAS
jgi:predicted RNA-binding Zn-ribbon protein involved in translation (DUF1610 family)